jgi:hypothetical protein
MIGAFLPSWFNEGERDGLLLLLLTSRLAAKITIVTSYLSTHYPHGVSFKITQQET